MRILALAGVTLIAVTGATAGTGPQVGLADRAPVRVVGTGFAASDHVTVRVHETAGATFGRVVTAGSGGGFVARFPSRSLDPCDGYVVTATGTSGRRASHREPPPPCGMDPGQ
jgi:hypothetical protein